MGVKIRIKADIDPNMLDRRAERADEILALQAKKDTSQFVPALNGDLDRRTRVVGGKIIYPGPQSRYLYGGKLMVDPETGSSFAQKGSTKVLTDKNLVFSKSMHSKAQDHWFEASKSLSLDKWLRVYGRALKNG